MRIGDQDLIFRLRMAAAMRARQRRDTPCVARAGPLGPVGENDEQKNVSEGTKDRVAIISVTAGYATPATAGQFDPPPVPPPVRLAPLPMLPPVAPAPVPPVPPVWLERGPRFAWIADEQSRERAERDRERAARDRERAAQDRERSARDRAEGQYERAKNAIDTGGMGESDRAATIADDHARSRADAALYWQAYSLDKLNRQAEALTAVAQLAQGLSDEPLAERGASARDSPCDSAPDSRSRRISRVTTT